MSNAQVTLQVLFIVDNQVDTLELKNRKNISHIAPDTTVCCVNNFFHTADAVLQPLMQPRNSLQNYSTEGVFPYMDLYRYVWPPRVWFLSHFGQIGFLR